MQNWLYRRLHPCWLISATCAGFVVGVWLALFCPGLGSPWAGVLIPCCFIVRRRWVIPVLILVGLLVGVWHGSATRQASEPVKVLYGQTVLLRGSIKEDPSTLSRGKAVQLTNVTIGGQVVVGSVLISTLQTTEMARGDIVEVKGLFTEGFGTFVGMMREVSVVTIQRPVPGDVGRVVRDWFAAAVRQGIPEPQASLGTGYLMGQKSALPNDLAESLQIAGLTHIVVASGYNLTVLVRLARRLFVKHSRYWAMLSAAVMIAAFVSVTGLSPSMTRAGIVSALSLLAWGYGRSSHPLVLLPFVAAMTVWIQPSYAWGDLGWQLSFAAFFGVMILAPLLQRYFFGDKQPGVLRQVLGETVAAHLVTLPIIIISFGVVSHVAILANVLIVPLVPLAMLLTCITGVVGLIAPAVAVFVGLPATWLLTYMTETATYVSRLSWAQSAWQPDGWVLAVYTVVVLGACVYLHRITRHRLIDHQIV